MDQNINDMRIEANETTLIKHFLSIPFSQKIEVGMELLRGVFLWPALAHRAWIRAGKQVEIHRSNGQILIDRYCKIRRGVQISVSSPDPQKPAILEIGYNTAISEDTKINVGQSVKIGKRVSIGWNVDILDNSFHRIIMEDGSSKSPIAPVEIEDDVWIGSHAIILRGVTIGHHSVIGAGAVVTSNIPPHSLVLGNPGRVVKTIQGWERNPHSV